jgi:hypothetical protein
MRLRLGLIIAAVLATLISPITPQAIAFGGYASAPNSVTATAIAGGIRVGWSAPTDVDTGVTGYRVEYSTSGTSGTWTLATTANSSTFSYDILGLSQTATYVRVAATTTAGTGTYGYPWVTIYSTTSLRRDSSGNVSYDAGYGLSSLGGQASNTYASANFTRVKYRLETTISSSAKYVETDFYTWPSGGATGSTAGTTAPSIAGIAIPSVNSGQQWIVQANVSDMNVYSDNTAVTKTISTSGRLEIWPWDYSWGPSALTPAGSSNNYDSGDSQNGSGGYGSFQVHDLTNSKPVFVWNNTGYSNGFSAEVAYGLNSGTNPDWTFCSQGGSQGSCPLPTSFKLLIYINPTVTPLADATPPTVSRGDAKTLIRSGDTISVRSTEIGTVYLVRNTVTVTNLASITAAAANVKNSVSISAINTSTTLTTSGLLDGTYNLYAVDSANNVSAALSATVAVDTTPPVATTFSVNTSGAAILMTIGETATLASFDGSAYSVSDSGSALSVTSASISGLVITLNLSRAIPAGATVTFAYSTSGIPVAGRWSDAAGNQLNNVTSRTITNNSNLQISVGLTVADAISKNTPITISASAAVAGLVTFAIAGKRIPGCFNKSATGSTPIAVTCTFKPALSGWQKITVTLVPTLSAYPTTLTTVDRFIAKRTNRR